MAKKTVTREKDGFKTIWCNGEDRSEVEVNVYQGDELLLEWVYPKVAGNSIEANADVWLNQAILEAKNKK